MFQRITTTWRRASIGAAAVLLAAPVPAFAEGRVAGAVLNGLTGQPVPGATVRLTGGSPTEGSPTGGSPTGGSPTGGGLDGAAPDATPSVGTTDPDGLFRIALPAGTYAAEVSKAGFETQRVAGIRVADGATNDLSVVLMPDAGSSAGEAEAAFGEEITVAAEADRSTEAALLAERKQAAQISDLIGSTEMAKTTGGDAAGVLKRVTGISLQDDKYVFVRGLGDRYSNTMLNGAKIPSTEFEKKVVPLDLFPTGLLDKVRVSKSYSVDKPGDFAAGFVELETLQFPTSRTAELGFSVGQDGVASGNPYPTYPGGLGAFGDGGQALPSSIPNADLIRLSPFTGAGFTPAELEAFGEVLVGDWQPSSEDAPLNRGYKLSYGDTFGRLGVILSTSYSNEFDRRDEDQIIYRVGTGGVVPDNDFDIATGEEQVRQSAIANLAYRLSPDHNLRLRSLYTNLATSEARRQEGFYSDFETNIRDFRLSYQEQEVVNVQLSGDHFFDEVSSAGSLVEWQVSTSTAETAENRRETIYRELLPGRFFLTSDAQSGFMYFNDLEDDLTDSGLHWTSFLAGDRLNGSLKAGLAYTTRDREFVGRRLRFFHRDVRGLDLTLPPDRIFTPETIGPNFEIEEITRPTDTYEGGHDVAGGYAQADLGWGRWRLIGGLRYESSEIELVTLDRTDPDLAEIQTTLAETDLLPALTGVYRLTPRMNLRAAFSQTVNRPEFRELAPFKFTHVVGGFSVTGNPELVSADISSYDVRWEWFPSADEVVALSAFYKDFDDPIEAVVVGAAELLETYENAEGAENYGFEVELRRNLGVVAEALTPFTAILNYTWVESEISIDPATTILTRTSRPLVGQPDNVINAVLEWSRPGWDTNLRLLYNLLGDKVAAGGALGLPDVVEEARSTLDVVWSQGLPTWAPGLAFKLAGSNLLDEPREWTQGGEIFHAYDPGREIGVSLSYSLY